MMEVKQLRFKYPGHRHYTLKGLDFHIPQGEIFGFLGPSGAGKSTTQKILIGMLKHYEGSVRIMGKELKDQGRDYYNAIGVAFEFPNFYSRFTALENLDLFRSLYDVKTEEPKQLLAQLSLEEYGHTKVSDFSKGMKMRLNLCRALMHRPEILFLDEPTSGLDPVNAKTVKDIILQLKSLGKTIIITTHNMNVAEAICDRVSFIVDGEIRLIDAPRALKVRAGKKAVCVEYREGAALRRADYQLEGIGANESFLRLLRSGSVETIHTQEASLDQLFIQVTGRTLT
ncbi:ABC transporter ATP-binding protein [Paenibacillus apiarius]|uniref:ABC transporter ATP-binding protein n=1 Tax=Paenibacillus apiarius TaxID=46240 RepID=A0ABT4DMU2_9BACL|nr:ABC transporter ATP-binding protein [Paenibacillus apiarius]MCY9514689.1 ABC transporter ATP-binding protein [Paenibacillus apiarius]MCY9518679.1 ABC transporter ATP-binding protein [Paenibacillus apiarius]MCY9552880.1 ABC transporter ATP-binding protein [Paenibacillus apiarius]MCY9556905.1 ABC transporter ATP-binding protein [Paenibacillus apiarius]MCY9686142.1 ABC transporter ATP-binding protein [Paenibacillus apiarius]